MGEAPRWPEWLEALVTGGHRVEVLPDMHRAFVRCVERWVDVVLVDLQTAQESVEAVERIRRLSPSTRILVIDGPAEPGTMDGSMHGIPGDASVDTFTSLVRSDIRSCRLDRERRDRLDQLRSLAHRVRSRSDQASGLDRWLASMTPASDASTSCMDALRRSMARDLDPLAAARETADFITRCLPDAVVAVWLASSATSFGLAACSGGAGPQADAVVRLLARVERSRLPSLSVCGGISTTEDALAWGSPEDAHDLGGRWAMLAPCRSDGQCHAAILILGSREPRPVPAHAALESVRSLLGNHLDRIERVHLRAQADWPPPAAEEPEDPPSEDPFL